MIKMIIEISEEKTREVQVHLGGLKENPTKGELLVLQKIRNNLDNLELEGIEDE